MESVFLNTKVRMRNSILQESQRRRTAGGQVHLIPFSFQGDSRGCEGPFVIVYHQNSRQGFLPMDVEWRQKPP